MATTRLMPLHIGKGRTVGTAIKAIIDYVKNPEKTDGGRQITSWQCDNRIADAQFLLAKEEYIKNTGRVRSEDNVIAYHLRQSLRPGEITPEEANRLGCALAQRFIKDNHAFIVCTHIGKALIWASMRYGLILIMSPHIWTEDMTFQIITKSHPDMEQWIFVELCE